MARKMSRGRQRIEMAKIKNEAQLLATFSKRRVGLFKLAYESCFCTGAEVALILFSPKAKTPFSFGCPSVQSVIDRYLNSGPRPEPTITEALNQFQRLANLEKLNEELTFLENKLMEEKKTGRELDRKMRERNSQYGWETPVEKLNLEQLEQMQMALQNLHPENMINELQNMFGIAQDPDPFHETHNTVVEHSVLDPSDGGFEYPDFLSKAINGGSSVDSGFPSTVTASSFNHMTRFASSDKAFGASQYATFPSGYNGGISINEACPLTMAGTSSSHLANLNEAEMLSFLEFAGPSRINKPSQPILEESSSTNLFGFDTRAP